MARGVSGPTWALLPPSNLPDESERTALLGSIVADFEHPLASYLPENASEIVPQKLLCKPTDDTNFKVALTNARGQGAHARLGDILKASFHKDINNETHLSTTIVQTYEVKRQDHVFELLKKRFKKEILAMIEKVPSRNKGAVFMIVAIKTCVDAQISSQDLKTMKASADLNVPATAIAAAATCAPMPANIDIGAGVSTDSKTTEEKDQIAKGGRIFAIQYRVIKKQSVWIRTKRPKDIDMGDYLVPKGNSMFGDDGEAEGEEDEDGIEVGFEVKDDEEGDDDDDDDDEDADPIQIGDLEHTWALGSSTDSEVVMAAL